MVKLEYKGKTYLRYNDEWVNEHYEIAPLAVKADLDKMYAEIDAYFYQNRIIVKRGKEYKTGEVLLAYLSRDFDDLTAMLNQCKHYAVNLHYSRAYKAHYARFLKKKMTQAEFQVWADYALDLRQQALDGAIEFESYREEIRK